MPPKEPTRHQLSSRLAYNQDTPAFLQRLKNQVAGISSHDEDAEFDEWQASSGRPPIPRRPSPPQRPEDDPGSADEDDEDEKPQIVVLKEGKHMSAAEVENEKRKAKGLPPVSTDHPVGDDQPSGSAGSRKDSVQTTAKTDAKGSSSTSLSFASFGVGIKNKVSSKKRKMSGDGDDNLKVLAEKSTKPEKKAKKGKATKVGTLLSFDEANEV